MANPTKGPLVILDGMSLAFRAYFALPPELATSSGVVTNAVHGFLSMLATLAKDHQPSKMAVAFDLSGGTFRDAMVEDYKGGRAETPEDLLPQFDMIRSLVEALGIPVLGVPQMEADDILATLATRAAAHGENVIVVTGDRDCFQLVEDPHIKVLYNRRGVSDYALYDEAGIVERTGVRPAKYPMLAAMRGDPSDNLPGVPGVGEKTAAKLLTTYGDLDGIFDHLDELTPKLRENLTASEQLARTNLEVMTLVRDVPLEVDEPDLELGGWDLADIEARFATLELTNLWRRYQGLLRDGVFGPGLDAAPTGVPPRAAADLGPVVLTEVSTPQDLSGALAAMRGWGQLVVAARFEGEPGRSALRGLGIVAARMGEEGYLLTAAVLDGPGMSALAEVLEEASFSGHDLKGLLRWAEERGVALKGLDLDTAIAAYLLDSSKDRYDLASVAGGAPVEAQGGFFDADALLAAMPAELAQVRALVARSWPALVDEGLDELYCSIERPLVGVLARMEACGIAVDRGRLEEISNALATEVTRLEAEVHALAGHPFNVNSTQQLRTVLYDELGLTPGRKTKTGYSTDAATLESLREAHPIVACLLEYREAEKLRSTYGEALLHEVAPDGRIHASFRQTVARTGRLSSEHPNLHNIPVRTEAGRQFRTAFIPRPGWSLLVADYDQIELRVIAHLSGDPGLIAAFTAGQDIHRAVAAGVYGVAPEEVTHAQRERAKMVSYGLAYGMEAFGLARRLNGSVEEAKEVMDRYFGAFPKVQSYMDSAVADAKVQGFTRTAMGRIRQLPELNDANFRVRQAAERQAMNAGIQGLAADIFKLALVRLDHGLTAAQLDARLVLQVHDEVLVEAPPSEVAAVEALVHEALEGAASLAVPLKLSVAWGPSWGAAKG